MTRPQAVGDIGRLEGHDAKKKAKKKLLYIELCISHSRYMSYNIQEVSPNHLSGSSLKFGCSTQSMVCTTPSAQMKSAVLMRHPLINRRVPWSTEHVVIS